MEPSITRRGLLAGLPAGVALAAGCSGVLPDGGDDASSPSVTRRLGDEPSGRELFVAPDGDDDGDGSESDPLATLGAARDVVREVVADGPPDGGVTVTLRGGSYYRSGTLELDGRDSGTAEAPVVYRSHPDETVALRGGMELSTMGFGPVSGAARERLRPEAREAVLELDLAGHGVAQYGRIRKRGFGWPSVPPAPELFVDGESWTLARWPDDGWVRTGRVLDEGGVPRHGGDRDEGATFEYTHDDRPAAWANVDDVWLYGYWKHDWADGNLNVARIDADSNVVETEGASFYGVDEGKRYYYYNVLEELSRPGEFYVDREGGALYVYPDEDFLESRVELSLTAEPLVRIDGADHLRLHGLAFETSRGPGVEATDVEGVVVEGCTFRKLGGRAVGLVDARESGVVDCRIDRVGTGGVTIDGGDRETLTPGNSVALNNRISRFSRIEETYSPAVALRGVGNRAAHNRLFDAPHMAVGFDGNEHAIEYNEIDHVARETSDVGAVYNGRNWTHRGTVIRHNFVHHVENDVGGVGQMGVYLDDALPATRVYGNLLYRVDRAMLIGGGRHNEIVNNLAVDCREGIRFDARTVPGNWAHSNCTDGWGMRERLREVPYREEPWASTYPELVDVLDDDPCLPKGNLVERNAAVGDLETGLDVAPPVREHGTVRNNLTERVPAGETGFDYEGGEPSLAADNVAAEGIEGWEPLPVEEMGVVVEGTRWERERSGSD